MGKNDVTSNEPFSLQTLGDTNICREIVKLFNKQTKNDVIQGAGQLGKNDGTWGQANSTGVSPDQKSKQS